MARPLLAVDAPSMLFRAFYGYAPRVTVVLKGQDPGRDATLAGRYARLFPGGVRVRWGGFEEFVAELAGAGGPAVDHLDHRFPAE